jgi:cytochrome c oxidase subunit IV
MNPAEKQSGGLATYLVIYVFILAIAGLQVVLAYTAAGLQQFVVMMFFAVLQAALAVTFFMHMRTERRGLFLMLIPAVIFVLLMMNMIWSDSFRISRGAPFTH